MWHNPSNNYEEYFRDHRERESEQWENQTPMESFSQQTTISMLQQILDNQTSQNEKMEEWDQQHHYEPQTEDMEYGWDREYQYEPSNVEMEYGWSHGHHYETSNEEIGYVEEYEHQQESFNPYIHYHDDNIENHREEEDLNMVLIQNLLDGQSRIDERCAEMESKADYAYSGLSAQISTLTDYCKALEDQFSKAEGEIEEIPYEEDSVQEGEIEEISKEEDTDQESGICDVSPEEYDVVDELQGDCTQLQCLFKEEKEIAQLHEDILSKDVQNALFPIEEEIEEIEEILEDEDATLEDEVVDVCTTYYEDVVEHKDDQILTQQQSLAEEEVVEVIQLHEDSLDIDALALIVAVTNKETLRYNNASTKYANEEEEEVVQLFELSQKELGEEEVAESKVPGSPTPRLQHQQCPRKRCEWKIKHKWREKPCNV